MATWSDLVKEFNDTPDLQKVNWLYSNQIKAIREISALRSGRQVILYGSAFMQKPQIPSNYTSISNEDLNGLMSALHKLEWDKGLTLILHTAGGSINATESIVSYLRSKFASIEVIVPTLAMSAGTMISLACERVIMAHHSQLGPIDPQMNNGGKSFSARAVVEQFETAKLDIVGDSKNGVAGNIQMAHLWGPILQSLAPSLVQEAKNALNYSEEMVAKWATDYMFVGGADADAKGKAVARHFSDANLHKSHGHRIGRDEAQSQGVVIEELEGDHALQEAVLTLYHLMTIAFDNTIASKVIISQTGNVWVKNFLTPEQAAVLKRGASPAVPVARPPMAAPSIKTKPVTPPGKGKRKRK